MCAVLAQPRSGCTPIIPTPIFPSFILADLSADIHRSMRRAARINPTPKVRTAAARNAAPM